MRCAMGMLVGAGLAGAAAQVSGAAVCDADISGDGTVNTLDLGILLSNWTLPPAKSCAGSACESDLNGDGVVNTLDLGFLLSAWDAVCNQPTETELAGNSLTQYPFFEYVTAFNQGAPIRVALDPTRFPSIVGDTADIYIVADKTAAQWAADPSLADLTPGGAMTVTFAGGAIQANTFTVDTGTLSGAAGIDIGVPYDVVVDVNQNGVLDFGDFIDGLSGAGGLYVVHDVTALGPLAVAQTGAYSVAAYGALENPNQWAYYPAQIRSLEELPIVVIGPALGAYMSWFEYLGVHLASYGYVVVVNGESTVAGPFSGSTGTLQHTDAFLELLPTIAGGAMNGHVDPTRIVWIGHGRAGESVVLAYDRLVDGTWTPRHFSIGSIRLLVSLAPTVFSGPDQAAPHGVPYHVFFGGADGYINGCASSSIGQPMILLDRAQGPRQATYVHGMGHGDFWGPGSSMASGPCLIGKSAAHQIINGYILPLIKHYVEGNIPAKDFLTRQWESFRPIGAPTGPCVAVDLMYQDGPSAGNFIIDNYQTEPGSGVSSSGGAVSFNVTNLVEGRLDDANGDFTWIAADPMNGMTYAGANDTSSGVVFDWNSPSFYELAIVPGAGDFTNKAFLSFRACQGTRHPNTILELGDLTFNVTLRDAAGQSGTINIGAYGGGVEEPYQRTSCGSTGAGWNNEFETIRIRLTDFLNDGSGLDLGDIVAVRFDFGAPGTSAVGRLGLDEIMLTEN